MKNIQFIKMHGLGNDFVIIDSSEDLDEVKKIETLKKIGSRNYGVGCDQILIIESSNYKKAVISIFNNDYLNKSTFYLILSIFLPFILTLFVNFQEYSIQGIFKSLTIALVYPLSYIFGIRLSNNLFYKNDNYSYHFLLYSILFLGVIFINPFLYYEPSAAARTWFGASILFFYIFNTCQEILLIMS